MTAEYADSEQRFAVCATQTKAKPPQDVFLTREEAEARAKIIGCEGSHPMEIGGQMFFMPCDLHDDYDALNPTGMAKSNCNCEARMDQIIPNSKGIQSIIEDEESVTIVFSKVATAPPEPEELEEDGGHLEDEEDEMDEKSAFHVAAELKAYHEDDEDKPAGRFTGYASIFGNTDLGNDVIEKGAFSKTLRRTGAKGVKLLYQHDAKMPIGVFRSIEEDEKGLRVEGELAMRTEKGREAYELMKMGALDGLSIGFRTTPKGYHYDKKTKRRIIKELELMEISVVTFPMNPKAKVRSMKASEMSIRDWERGMRDAFGISRSEAKAAARAVFNTIGQREADEASLLASLDKLSKTLKS